jgi:hypothetical protein
VGCGGTREDVAGGTEVGGTRVAGDTGGGGRDREGARGTVEGEGHSEVGRGWRGLYVNKQKAMRC